MTVMKMKMLNIIPYPKKVITNDRKAADINSAAFEFIEDSSISPESFRIEYDCKEVKICYSDESGKFYALQTIAQLKRSGKVPAFTIEDCPIYSYRGFSLDCARHSFKIPDIKKLIDAAALFRLNRFHWHLTDDQGWRIEMSSHKRLNKISSVRKKSTFGGVIDEHEYRALFTKEEIKEIVEYCKERHIEVIPEIDMPGHASAILAAYPELGCSKKPVEVQTKQGIYKNILCVSNENVYSFVYDILDEICELFPYEYIHIGGDETPTKSWEECPNCRKMKEELGLKDFNALQSVFTKRIADYLKSKGRKAIVWNESLKGGIPKADSVCVQHWMGGGNSSFEYAEKGGEVIESDFFHYYCDYPYGMTPLKKTYNFRPEKKYKNCPAKKPFGIEAEMWTEYVRDFDTLCYRYFPRIAAIAETAWGYKTSYKDFTERFKAIEPILNENGIKPAPIKDRDLNPLLRVPDIIKFFSGSLNPKALKDHMDVK